MVGIGVKYPVGYWPGSSHVYVLCDICHGKYHRYDTQLILDRYNLNNGKVVCYKCNSKTNVQIRPVHPIEELITDAESLRNPRPLTYITPDNTVVPSVPTDIIAFAMPDLSGIRIEWYGQQFNQGSSSVIGWHIQRANPQLSTYYDVIANTDTYLNYWLDTTANLTVAYTYRIAAINSAGQGAWSTDIFYPYQVVDYNTQWLITETGQTITTEDGKYIIL